MKKLGTGSEYEFSDHPAIVGREDKFVAVIADVAAVLAGWKLSLFAHEWLSADGKIKSAPLMSETARAKRAAAEEILRTSSVLERPVLGLGILDTIEFGAGKEIFLCLAAMGATAIPVHIPKSQMAEFQKFLSP